MVLKLLKKALGLGNRSAAVKSGRDVAPGIPGFVEFVVCELVDSPDKVNINVTEDDRRVSIKVTCDKKDMGKIIGKNGKTIAAIRALATGAARRAGKRVLVDVLD